MFAKIKEGNLVGPQIPQWISNTLRAKERVTWDCFKSAVPNRLLGQHNKSKNFKILVDKMLW